MIFSYTLLSGGLIVNVLKFQLLVIKAGTHKMLLRKANRDFPD